MRGNEAILKNFKGKWMGKDTGKKKKQQKAQIMKVLAQLGRILLLSASCSHTQSNLQLRYKPIRKRHKKFPALMTVYYH